MAAVCVRRRRLAAHAVQAGQRSAAAARSLTTLADPHHFLATLDAVGVRHLLASTSSPPPPFAARVRSAHVCDFPKNPEYRVNGRVFAFAARVARTEETA
jgi:hypothetical protein